MTTAYAKTLGMIAFENGKMPQAGADKELMDEVKKVGSFTKEGIKLMKAWNAGWHKANAA